MLKNKGLQLLSTAYLVTSQITDKSAPSYTAPDGTVYTTLAEGEAPQAKPMVEPSVYPEVDPVYYEGGGGATGYYGGEGQDVAISVAYPDGTVSSEVIDSGYGEPVPLPYVPPPNPVSETGCPTATIWNFFKDPECRDLTDLGDAFFKPKSSEKSCNDDSVDEIIQILIKNDFKSSIRMVEEEGSDTVEFYERLREMGWYVESITDKPDGSGRFLGTLKKWLYSSDYRLIAKLMGLDTSSVPTSSVQIKCPQGSRYFGVDFFDDSYLCNTKPS